MTAASWWWLAAGIAVALELSSGTVYLLMLAVGLACAAVTAGLGASAGVQLLVAASCSALAMGGWHWSRTRRASGPDAPSNPDLHLDIGQTVHVAQWNADGTTRVHYRGTEWSARLAPDAPPRAGTHTILAIEGSQLILSN
jgi:membrane protein implicated in regulation of membrane protease activity